MTKAQFRISESFTVQAVVWSPAAPRQRTFGTLHYSPTGGISFRSIGPNPTNFSGLLHGLSIAGVRLTLLDSFEKSTTEGASGLFDTEIHADRAVMGAHLSLEQIADQPSIRAVYVSIFSLDLLLNQRGFHGPKLDGNSLSITWCRPPSETATVSGFGTITTAMDASQLHEWNTNSITAHGVFKVEPQSPLTLEGVHKLVDRLQRLTAALAGSWLPMREIRMHIDREDDSAQLIYGQIASDLSNRATPGTILVAVEESGATGVPFSQVVPAWFELATRAPTALDVFFSSLASPPMFIDAQLISFAQVLESLHRAVEPKQSFAVGDEWERIASPLRAAIPREIDAAFRQSLLNKIRFAHEVSLRRRLRDLLAKLPEDVVNAITSNVETFVDSAVKTRNHLTHLNDKPEDGVWSGDDLLYGAHRLRLICQLLILSLMDLPSPLLRNALKRQTVNWILEHKM